jgi:N-acetyl-1-D-myo-inositol-2-amino-2-deoxy-alpha-D-glucopyranoside deacetylase
MPTPSRDEHRRHPRHVLAVFAHPDDEILCGAGTLAMCAARGAHVTLVCATRGELGPIASPELATHETLPRVREAELRASCAKLGIEDVRFLGLPDAGVSWAAEEAGTVSNLVVLIRELKPRVILTFGPDGLYGHSDHGAIGELTTNARSIAADPHAIPDAGRGFAGAKLFYPVITGNMVAELIAGAQRAGIPDSLWKLAPANFAVDPSSITTHVDVTSVLSRKLAALRCHRTQLEADNVLSHLTPELAQQFFGTEWFRCVDGGTQSPLDALGD